MQNLELVNLSIGKLKLNPILQRNFNSLSGHKETNFVFQITISTLPEISYTD